MFQIVHFGLSKLYKLPPQFEIIQGVLQFSICFHHSSLSIIAVKLRDILVILLFFLLKKVSVHLFKICVQFIFLKIFLILNPTPVFFSDVFRLPPPLHQLRQKSVLYLFFISMCFLYVYGKNPRNVGVFLLCVSLPEKKNPKNQASKILIGPFFHSKVWFRSFFCYTKNGLGRPGPYTSLFQTNPSTRSHEVAKSS